jgi:hypothetical protein
VYNVPAPALRIHDDSEDEVSVDEAERTLNSIIESADEAQQRVRRILDQSLEDSSIGTLGDASLTRDETPEMSVWGEQSFFRRMAQKAPGGWAFTPQPKLRRVTQETPVKVEIVEVHSLIKLRQETTEREQREGRWWGFWRRKRKELEDNEEPESLKTPPSSPPTSPPKVQVQSSPLKPFQSTSTSLVPLSSLSEKRLRLARSLQLLQSDIRLAREGIETLETRLEHINLASTARQIDSERRAVLRRQRGDPPPTIDMPSNSSSQMSTLPGGTYLWMPFQRGWVVLLLWFVLLVQAGMVIWMGWDRRTRWEPYSFGQWAVNEHWPT